MWYFNLKIFNENDESVYGIRYANQKSRMLFPLANIVRMESYMFPGMR